MALRRKLIADFFVWAPVAVISGTVVLVRAWRHDFDFGLNATLTYGFALPGFLFWRRYPRWSPGVVTSAGGFFTVGRGVSRGSHAGCVGPDLKVNPELWNTPKYFVAFGMILTLLEDKSEFLEVSGPARAKTELSVAEIFRHHVATAGWRGGEFSLPWKSPPPSAKPAPFNRVVIILSPDGKICIRRRALRL